MEHFLEALRFPCLPALRSDSILLHTLPQVRAMLDRVKTPGARGGYLGVALLGGGQRGCAVLPAQIPSPSHLV